MPDWEHIPYFLAAARTRSLRAAAEAMGATHATVGRQIAALEGLYGVQLVRRDRTGLTLTPAGERLLAEAEAAEGHLGRARAEIAGLDRETSGLVRIAVDPMTAHLRLAPLLARFAARHPGIEFDIRLGYEIEDIEGRATDISIRHAAEVTDDVTGRRLGPLPIGIFAARTYLAERFAEAGDGGAGLDFIGYGPVPELLAWVARSPFPRARVRHVVMDPEMHLHLARAGAGMTFLPDWCATLWPELARVPGTVTDDSRHTWVLLHSDLRRVARVRRLVDFLAAELRPGARGEKG